MHCLLKSVKSLRTKLGRGETGGDRRENGDSSKPYSSFCILLSLVLFGSFGETRFRFQ